MRWVYTKPERKEFVSDGQRIYSYLPADKQVIVSPDAGRRRRRPRRCSSPAAATSSATSRRLLHELPGAAPGLVGLKLVPKRADPELEWLILGVDPATLQIRHLVAADRQGGRSTFTFSNLKENRNLSDKLFAFQIPRGVDVITNGAPAK